VFSPSRRSLDAFLKRLQITKLDNWPTHLRGAFEVVAMRKSVEEAKVIIFQSVEAAHRCAQGISQMLLFDSQSSSSKTFQVSCLRIANCMKPNRLRREKRDILDEIARRAFVRGDVNGETISDFFLECWRVLEQSVEDKNSAQILKYLGIDNDRPFGEIEKKRGGFALPLVTCYESLPPKLQLDLESILRNLAKGQQLLLTAHDVFIGFANPTLSPQLVEGTNSAEDLLASYVEDVATVWIGAGLEVGRGTKPDDGQYIGPFEKFVEQVLLSQFDTRFSVFDRPDEEQSKKARQAFYALPKDFQKKGSASIHKGTRLITARLLRRVLAAFKKSRTNVHMT